MKKLLLARFLPPNYGHDKVMFRHYQKRQKDRKVVDQYVEKFNRQSSCDNILVSKLQEVTTLIEEFRDDIF